MGVGSKLQLTTVSACTVQISFAVCSALNYEVMLQRLIVAFILVAKFTDEQYTTIIQSRAGRFDPRVFVPCKQLTKTLWSKRPALDCVIVLFISEFCHYDVVLYT